MAFRRSLFIVLFFANLYSGLCQSDSATAPKPLSKFDKFNAKAENLFKVMPVPLFSYSLDAGNVFGLAKFNLFHLYKNDTITRPSKFSEVFTVSTKGRINASVSNELLLKDNKYIILSFFNYRKQPEYFFGIGNDVTKANLEEISSNRIKASVTGLKLVHKYLYAGIAVDVTNYFNIKTDTNSYLIKNNTPGLHGGWSVGAGLAGAYDSRDNRYNPSKGAYIISSFMAHPEFIGSEYQFTKFQLDARKFFNPWLRHVIAIQTTTTIADGNIPFYELAFLGGDSKMRGYYEGAFRDKSLIDGQIEYRMPIWSIFGITSWIGTGRVAPGYSDMALEGLKLSYGGGIRIKVDSKNNTNLRFDFGFGPNGIQGTYISFAEAF